MLFINIIWRAFIWLAVEVAFEATPLRLLATPVVARNDDVEAAAAVAALVGNAHERKTLFGEDILHRSRNI